MRKDNQEQKTQKLNTEIYFTWFPNVLLSTSTAQQSLTQIESGFTSSTLKYRSLAAVLPIPI